MATKRKKQYEEISEEREREIFSQIAKNIIDYPLEKFLHDNYLPYSYYTIRNRALVNSDGLKPVNRRILYSMFKSRITPSSAPVKVNKIVGDVMGLYHPHGDAAIEKALARMAQPFAMRIPLITPAGAVGAQTGDKAAAGRYLEAKLSPAAMELLAELNDNALPMGRNYDDTLDEPAILPSRWPASLINGTEGIAVGFASNIFPHNPDEIMDVVIAKIRNKDITLDEVLEIMPGPDFPTGGEIIGAEKLKDCYENGQGSFIVRGRYEVLPLSRGRSQIVFYELPYQVATTDISNRIAKLQKEKKAFSEISEVKDLSDNRKGLRLAINTKSGTNTDLLIEKIFKDTAASSTFSFNMTFLINGTPMRVGLLEFLDHFIELRYLCLSNTLKSKIEKLEKDIELNSGIIQILIDLDKAISIIRSSIDEDSAREELIKEFKINENQANYILSLRLKTLTKKNREDLIEKNNLLKTTLEHAQKTLNDDELFKEELIRQLEETKKVISDPRRTIINNKTVDDLKEELNEIKTRDKAITKNSNCFFVFYADGSVSKHLKEEDYKNMNVKIPYLSKMTAKTNDELIAVLESGKGLKVPSTYIPFDKKVSLNSLGLSENAVGFGKVTASNKDLGLLLITNKGKVSLINGKYPTTAKEVVINNLDDNEKITYCAWLTKKDIDKNLLIGTDDGYVTMFPVSEIRSSNPGAKPIKGMIVNEGHEIIGSSIINKKGVILTTSPLTIKLTDINEIPMRKRGAKGVIIQRLQKNDKLNHLFATSEDDLNVSDKLGNEMFLPQITKRTLTGMKFSTFGLVIGKKHIFDD